MEVQSHVTLGRQRVITNKNDNIWTAEFHGSKLAKLEPKTGKITEYDPPTQPALIRRLNVDSDGVRRSGRVTLAPASSSG